MIGDAIIISNKDYHNAGLILKQVNDKKIILIGGGSGTKKSELAYCLQKLLNDKKKSSFVVSLDDFYSTMPSIRNYNRKKMGLDSVGIGEIDWESLQRIYEDFQTKKEIHFKRVHRFLDAVEHNTIDSEEIDYLICEGLYTNYLRKFYSDNFSVFLEGNPTQTLAFRKMRGKEDEVDTFRQTVVDKEHRITSQLKRYSELIIPFEEK